MDADVESGRKKRRPWVRTRFNLDMNNERSHAGRESQTCVARPYSQGRTGTGSAGHEQDWQPNRP